MRDARRLEMRNLVRSRREFDDLTLLGADPLQTDFHRSPLANAAWNLVGSRDPRLHFPGTPSGALTGYSLTPSSTTVVEGNSSITFTITRSGDKPAETIYASTLFDTARSPGDYDGLVNFSVSFSSGQTSKTFTVGINDDTTIESTEHFRVMIAHNTSDGSAQAIDISDIFIQDNDTPATAQYSLTPSSTTKTEGNISITFTITRSGAFPAETIYASTLFDTARSPGDYDGLVNQAVSFSSGQTSRTFTVDINDDNEVESTEHFRVMIAHNTSDGSSQAIDISDIFIEDNDAPATAQYSLTPSSTTQVEANTSITFTITRSGAFPAETLYASTLFDTASSPGDYDGLVNLAISFASGQTSKTFTVDINDDSLVESTEHFRVMIAHNTGDGSAQAIDISDVFIQDNDTATPPTSFTITPAATSVSEGSQLVFTIARTGNLSDQTVYFSAWKDTASFAAGDYSLVGGGEPTNYAIHFAAGDPSESVSLAILQDGHADAGERFRAVVQGNPPDSNPAINLAQTDFITINESTPQNTAYTLTPSSLSVTEGSQMTFTVTRTGDKPGETVYFSTLTDGTATYAEGDYVTSSGGKPLNIPVVFNLGATTASTTITLNIRDDNMSDSGEEFRAIVQRHGDDAVSTYLSRSNYVRIDDVGITEDPSEADQTGDILALFATVAHAAEKIPETRLHLPFKNAVTALITQGAGGAESHNMNTATTAVDFAIAKGVEIRAMVGGSIVHIESGHPNYTSDTTVDGNLNPIDLSYTNFGPGQLGNFITIKHSIVINGAARTFYATYAHLDPEIGNRFLHATGDVFTGMTLGKVGWTGAIQGSHVHVQVGWQMDSRGIADGPSISDRGETGNFLMSQLRFAEGDLPWPQEPLASESRHVTSENDPTLFDHSQSSQGRDTSTSDDIFILGINDLESVVNVFASGANAVLDLAADVQQYILKQFEDIKIVGGNLADRLNIGSLFETTIKHNTIYFDGGAGDDFVDGSQTDRRISAEGGSGNDTFISGSDNDIFFGGEDNDTYILDSFDTIVEAASEGFDYAVARVSLTLNAGAAVELLGTTDNAGAASVNLTGNEFAQTIIGNAGANTLNGGGGSDILVGFGGDDTYFVDSDDQVREDAGGGFDYVVASTSYALNFGAEIELLGTTDNAGMASIDLTGNNFAQIIIGNAGMNSMRGGPGGGDVLVGFGGNDTYFVDGNDQIREDVGGGFDYVVTSTSYALNFGAEIELLGTVDNAGTGNFTLTGNNFAQVIIGNAGDNILNGGGGGADVLNGFAGNDTLFVDADDIVREEVGNGYDYVVVKSSYTLNAGAEIELMTTTDNAGTEAFNLTGNEFANIIQGNQGANVLNGGLGMDRLVGLGGADGFAFTTALGGGNVDMVADFVHGTDKILLGHAIFAALSVGALASGAFATGAAAADGDDRIVYNSANGGLFYDADGAGGAAAVQFATLQAGLGLTASDFQVI